MLEFPILDIAGVVEIPHPLRELEEFIATQSELALIDIADDLVNLYQQEIVAAGSVDTGFFLNTVRVRRANAGERDVASDAFYSGVVRAKGSGGEVIGPAIAERAASEMGRSIENAFNRYLV